MMMLTVKVSYDMKKTIVLSLEKSYLYNRGLNLQKQDNYFYDSLLQLRLFLVIG